MSTPFIIISKKDVSGCFCTFTQKGEKVKELRINHLDIIYYQISGKDEGGDEFILNNCSNVYIKDNGVWYVEENGVEYKLDSWLFLDHKDGEVNFDNISI